MFTIESNNLTFLEKVSVDELSQHMLHRDGVMTFGGKDDRNYIEVLIDTANESKYETRQKVGKALVKAIADWDPEKYGENILSELAVAGGILNNEEMVPNLVNIVDTGKITPSKDNSNLNFAKVVASIVGSETAEGRDAVKRWYGDDGFDWKCTSLLVHGIVMFEPDRAEEVLPKLLYAMEQHPDYFYAGLIASDLCNCIGPDRLEKVLGKFSGKAVDDLKAGLPVAKEIYIETEIVRSVASIDPARKQEYMEIVEKSFDNWYRDEWSFISREYFDEISIASFLAYIKYLLIAMNDQGKIGYAKAEAVLKQRLGSYYRENKLKKAFAFFKGGNWQDLL